MPAGTDWPGAKMPQLSSPDGSAPRNSLKFSLPEPVGLLVPFTWIWANGAQSLAKSKPTASAGL